MKKGEAVENEVPKTSGEAPKVPAVGSAISPETARQFLRDQLASIREVAAPLRTPPPQGGTLLDRMAIRAARAEAQGEVMRRWGFSQGFATLANALGLITKEEHGAHMVESANEALGTHV